MMTHNTHIHTSLGQPAWVLVVLFSPDWETCSWRLTLFQSWQGLSAWCLRGLLAVLECISNAERSLPSTRRNWRKKKNWEGSCILRTCHGRPKQKGSPVQRLKELETCREILRCGYLRAARLDHGFHILSPFVSQLWFFAWRHTQSNLIVLNIKKNSRSMVRIVSRLVARLPGSMKHIMWDHCSRCWSPGWWWGEQPTGGGLTKGADFNFQEWAGADSGQHHSWTTRNTRHTRTTGT